MTRHAFTGAAIAAALAAVLATGASIVRAAPARPDARPTSRPTPRPATRPTTQPARATTRPAIRTEAEIRETLQRGDYRAALKQIERALAAAPNNASPRNAVRNAAQTQPSETRLALLMLKADTQLRLQQYAFADVTFGVVARSSADPAAAATARAMRRILHDFKAPRIHRQLLGPDEKPDSADLLDPAERDHVLAIARADVRRAAAKALDEATKGDEFPPILKAIQLLGSQFDFEMATGGDVAAVRASANTLRDRANKLILESLTRMDNECTVLFNSAITVIGRTASREIYRGLSAPDKQRLYDIVDNCQTIVGILSAIEGDFGAATPNERRLMANAKEVGRVAKNTVSQSYTDR